MRYLLALALLVPLGSRHLLTAGEREDALVVIDKAIAAHGGEAALTRAQNAVRKGSGVLVIEKHELLFTDIVFMSLPSKVRLNVELEKRASVITVINGDKGWQRSGGDVKELGKDIREEIREEAYIWWLTTLVPLKKADFTLAPVAEIQVDGKPAVGVKVSSKGFRQARLYFDKTSGLLVKITGAARFAGLTVEKEYLYSGYKEFDGARLYTRCIELVNGKKNSELKTATYDLTRPSDTVFNRP